MSARGKKDAGSFGASNVESSGKPTGDMQPTYKGKITKCATAGSFDDTEAVKQTRDLEIMVLAEVVVEQMEVETKTRRRGKRV